MFKKANLVSVQAIYNESYNQEGQKMWRKSLLICMPLAIFVFLGGAAIADYPSAGLNGDFFIDFEDFAVIGAQWLTTDPGLPDDMVYIPDGEFEMGGHFEDTPADEDPIHAVLLDAFCMSKFEITNQQYCDFLNSVSPHSLKVRDGRVVYAASDISNSYPYCNTYNSQIEYNDVSGTFSVRTKGEPPRDMSDDPMVAVSWYGAVAYCYWRSAVEGKEQCYNLLTWECDFSKHGYRLPTEAEWEYAARGGNHSPYYRYPWGDNIDGSMANYQGSGDPYEPGTTPVGYYNGNQIPSGTDMANGYGLYDMAGNVSEWCNDWYDSGYYNSYPYDNPEGPGSGTDRVIRGGSWRDRAGLCRVSSRICCITRPDSRSNDRGFRIVLDLKYNVIGLEIVGPNEVAENSQVQYKAIAVNDNNNTKDVTALVEWSVKPNDIASITAGQLTTEMVDLPEDVTITARYSEDDANESAEKEVSILAACPSGSALDFDGVDDYVDLGNNSNLKPPLPVTISAWIKLSTTDIYQYFIRLDKRTAYFYGIWFYFSSHYKKLSVGYGDGGAGYWDRRLKIGTTELSSNTWYHVVAVINGPTDMSLYINGIDDGGWYRGSGGSLTYSNGNSSIGSQDIISRNYFSGKIDDVRIYNRALYAEEIQASMHSRADINDPNLVAYWDFDEGEGQVVYDKSGNGNDGVLGISLDPDYRDPTWVEPGAPIEAEILDLLNTALGKEEAFLDYMDEAFHAGVFGDLDKNEVVKCKQKILGAMQQEEQAETAVDQSIDKLDDALNTLGIE
jgi:formylglycine-generating enzyme required for sulfatase activity